MARDGSGIYTLPDPVVIENTTIESAVYNRFTGDVATEFNSARPIIAGGTGANNADGALVNVSGEKATQLVTSYDTQLWFPGSFRSAVAASGAPNATASFAGIAYINEALANPPINQNVVLEARDLTDGMLYVKRKTAGVWGVWDSERTTIAAAPFDALAYNGMQVNGSMDVSQEKGTTPSTVSANFVVDAWTVQFVGTMAISAVQVADAPPGLSNSLKISVTTAQASLGVSDYTLIQTNIEGFRTSRLAFGVASAQSVSLGFWTKINRTGTYSGSIRNSALNRSYPFTFTQNVSNTWEYKTVTVPGDITGTWIGATNGVGLRIMFTMAVGTGLQGAAGSWAAANMIGTTGTTNGVAATSDTFQVTGVVLLPGTQALAAAQSPLIMRPYDQELVTCQRYYQKFNYVSSDHVATLQAVSTATANGLIRNITAMRVAATVVMAPAIGSFSLQPASGGNQPLTGASIGPNSITSIYGSFNVAGGLIAGNATSLFASNASLIADARL